MSFGERDAVSSLITMFLFVLLSYWYLGGNSFDGADGLMIWARSVLKMILAGMAIAIVVSVVGKILQTMWNRSLTGEDKLSDLSDERDRLIEVRGMRIGSIALIIGIVVMILDLAFNSGTALRALNLVLLSCAMSEIVKNIYKIYRYRIGF